MRSCKITYLPVLGKSTCTYKLTIESKTRPLIYGILQNMYLGSYYILYKMYIVHYIVYMYIIHTSHFKYY